MHYVMKIAYDGLCDDMTLVREVTKCMHYIMEIAYDGLCDNMTLVREVTKCMRKLIGSRWMDAMSDLKRDDYYIGCIEKSWENSLKSPMPKKKISNGRSFNSISDKKMCFKLNI